MGCCNGCCNGADKRSSKIGQQWEQRYMIDSSVFQDFAESPIFRALPNARERLRELIENISKRCSSKKMISVRLAFRASECGFKAAAFRQKCQNKSCTIVVAHTRQDKIFGGFTPCSWGKEKHYEYTTDEHAASFLFKLSSQAIQFFNIKAEETGNAIMNHEESGPIFGKGHDLYIADLCDRRYSWNNIGRTYSSANFTQGTKKANKLLSGQEKHKLKDQQVWEVVF